MTAAAEPELLREPPPFRRDRVVHAWIGVKGISDAGETLWTIALAWTAVQIASPVVAGLVVAAGTIPRGLALLFGGVLADRADARTIMIGFNVVRVVVLVGVALASFASPPTIGVLVAAAIVFGLCDAFFLPAVGTVGRRLVRTDDLPRYTALIHTASRLGNMAGAAVGGVLVAQQGMAGAASTNAVIFALVIAFIAIFLRSRFALPQAERESPLRSIGRAFVHLREQPQERTLVLAVSGLNIAVIPAIGLGLPLRASAEGWGAQAVGFFEVMIGIGATLGALTVARWQPRRTALVGFVGLILQGAGIVVLGLGGFWTVAAGALLIGTTAGYGASLLSGTFAATIDPAYLGRMTSVVRLVDNFMMPVMMTAFGALAGALPIWAPFALFGAIMMAMMALPLTKPYIRGLTTTKPKAPAGDDAGAEGPGSSSGEPARAAE